MYWLEVSVKTDGEAAEAVSDLLQPYAHQGSVVIEQLGDPNSVDPYALEPHVRVKIYIPGNDDSPALRLRLEESIYHLSRLYPIPAPVFRKLKDQDWVNAWREHYRPFRIGRRLWIQPSWQRSDVPKPGDIVITLDPGMAFGTGLHPSTQMCLQALEGVVQLGDSVLDVGTGSGILAIGAVKLGAAKVLAFDIDRVAVETTQQNAAQNRVHPRIAYFQGELSAVVVRPWRIVVANILAPVLSTLLLDGRLLDYVAMDGRLILSGIIDEQMPQIVRDIVDVGGSIEATYTVRDWVCLVAKHKNATP
jgi:ribosomal protein L11 methyltransferase